VYLQKVTNDKNQLIDELKNKNEEVMLYSNMMSHDLKAPLGNIEGLSLVLQKRLKGADEKHGKILNVITDSVKSMRKLIDNLLQYSKSHADDYDFQDLELDGLIGQVLTTFNHDIEKNNVEITRTNLSAIYGNEETLALVFQNLISNAIKFQPKIDGHIPKIKINQITKTLDTEIVVSDNGIGLEEDKVNEIFAPFKRFHSSKDYKGTGLGMSIVKKLIEKHNGSISVKSKLGSGTTFTISLPKPDTHQSNVK